MHCKLGFFFDIVIIDLILVSCYPTCLASVIKIKSFEKFFVQYETYRSSCILAGHVQYARLNTVYVAIDLERVGTLSSQSGRL